MSGYDGYTSETYSDNVSIVAEHEKGLERSARAGYLPQPKDNGTCGCGRATTKRNKHGWFCWECEFLALHDVQ